MGVASGYRFGVRGSIRGKEHRHCYGNGVHSNRDLQIITVALKLVVCILLRVLGQVQGFRLTQHCFKYFIQ
jgi:hypothetical protein